MGSSSGGGNPGMAPQGSQFGSGVPIAGQGRPFGDAPEGLRQQLAGLIGGGGGMPGPGNPVPPQGSPQGPMLSVPRNAGWSHGAGDAPAPPPGPMLSVPRNAGWSHGGGGAPASMPDPRLSVPRNAGWSPGAGDDPTLMPGQAGYLAMLAGAQGAR